MKPCPHCQGQNRDGARFCGHCAKQLSERRPMKPCPHCQGQNRDGARFCGHCAKQLSGRPAQGTRTSFSTAGNSIFLDSLDGAAFEELGAEIYRRLGYDVQKVQYVGDEGRDLILKSPDGQVIVVECKHWPGRAVGRPVVQKLHSAVLSYPAQKGVVLTTGYFPKTAYDYAKKLKTPIELIDWHQLKDLATKANIALLSKKEQLPLLSFRTSDDSSLKKLLDAQLFNRLLSSPAAPASLFQVTQRSVEWKPVYQVHYSLKQDFTTSVGVIHRLDIRDGSLLIGAAEGGWLPEGLASFIKATATLPFQEIGGTAQGAQQKAFQLGVTELKDIAKKRIVAQHRTFVPYVAGNDRRYTKECTPRPKSIFFKDIRQLYMPEQTATLGALQHPYRLHYVENGRDFFWLTPHPFRTCHICNARIRETAALLCNSCGMLAHPPQLFQSHSFRCAECDKTLCNRCTYWVRRWFLWKKFLCGACTKSYLQEKVRKLAV